MAEQENKKTPSIRVMARNILKSRFFLIFIIVAFIIIIAGSSYILKLIRIKEDSSNSKNAPAAVRSYTNSANIDEDGNINFEKTPNEFWEELKERNNDITKYFSSAEELAKIINVTTVTQFLYTGEYDNPEEETAEEVNEKVKELATDINSKNTQGIVKLKRALEDGKVIYMTYKTPSEFRDLINTYNENPSDDNKNEALKYFTVEQNASASNVVQTINDENDESDEEEVTINSLENVLFIGDSILERLRNKLEGEGAIVISKVGESADYFINKFDEHVNTLSEAPTAIYIILGQNNVSASGRMTVTKELVEKYKNKYPNINIYINSIVPAGPKYGNCDTWGPNRDPEAPSKYNEKQRSFNDELKEYCESENNLHYSYTLDGYEVDETKDELTDDGLHPNDTGVNVLFNNIKNNLSGISTNRSNTKTRVITQSKYLAKVAKFYETTSSEVSNDPSVTGSTSTEYRMTEQTIDYQYYTNKYTLPFNYLYAMLLISQDKDFTFELADLIYDSDLEITIKDNVTTTTTTNIEAYTNVEEYIFSPTLISKIGEDGNLTAPPSSFENIPSSISSGEYVTPYNITKTTISISDNLDVSLTLADSWWTKYEEKYEYTTKEGEVISSNSTTLENIINQTVTSSGQDRVGLKTIYENNYNVYVVDNNYNTKYKSKITNRSISNTTTETGNKYTSDPAKVQEKTSREDEPNFVSIFAKNTKARTNIISARKWLYRALESNEDTVNLLDITKYLIYKEHEEIGNKDGFKKFDFETVWDEYENSFKVVSQSYSGYRASGFTGNKGIIFNFLLNKGCNPVAASAILGNLIGESGGELKSDRIEKANDRRIPITSEDFTAKVNSGQIDKSAFMESTDYGRQLYKDINNIYMYGYGLAQWTFPTRKEALYNYAKEYAEEHLTEFDISDLNMQLEFMWEKEVKTMFVSEKNMKLLDYLTSDLQEENLEEATRIWQDVYEGGENAQRRIDLAKEVYDEYLMSLASGSIIDKCVEVMNDMINNGTRYSLSNLEWNNIKKSNNFSSGVGVCCATYVTSVLYRAGLLDEAFINGYNYNWSNDMINMMNATKWPEINPNEAEIGDICIWPDGVGITGHVFIYAGGNNVWEQSCGCYSSSGAKYTGGANPYWAKYKMKPGLRVWRTPKN